MATPSSPSRLALVAGAAGLATAAGVLALVPGGEAPRHDAAIAREARVIDPARPPADAVGRLVIATGPLVGAAPLGDALLAPGSYLALERKVERYVWRRERVLKAAGKDGPQRWVYETRERWEEVAEGDPPVVAGIGAKAPRVTSGKDAVEARIGALPIDLAALGGPGAEALRLEDAMFTRGEVHQNALYFRTGRGWDPHQGDLRVRWWVVPGGAEHTVLAKLTGPRAIAPFETADLHLYQLTAGDRAEALAQLGMMDEMGPAASRFLAWLGLLPAFALLKPVLDAWHGRRLGWPGVAVGAAAGVAAGVAGARMGAPGAIAAGLAALVATHALLARRPPAPPPPPRPLPLP